MGLINDLKNLFGRKDISTESLKGDEAFGVNQKNRLRTVFLSTISDYITSKVPVTDLSNYVTLDSNQTIAGNKTFTNGIRTGWTGNTSMADSDTITTKFSDVLDPACGTIFLPLAADPKLQLGDVFYVHNRKSTTLTVDGNGLNIVSKTATNTSSSSVTQNAHTFSGYMYMQNGNTTAWVQVV